MLTLGMAGSQPQMIMQPTSPMVYLDHWAMRRFSSDSTLGARFTKALEITGGSLAFSWLHFSEYAPVTIPEQRRQVERLLDAIIPAVFCLEVQPFAVVEREQAGHALPHADVVLAAALVARRQSTVKPFAATQLFSEVEALARGKDALATTVQQRLVHLQREFSSDPEFRKAVKQAETGPGKMAVTRTLAVVRALIETLIDDEKRSITTNDALDLLHTAVPLTYCDIILVDGAWFDRAERVRRKLEKGGSSISLGTAFSERKGGVERFLASFEEMR